MKKSLLILVLAFVLPVLGMAQCTTSNGTGCQCLDTSLSNCELLPDIIVSAYALQNYQGGPNEYPQTGAGTSHATQGPDDGRLRLSGSTPNIGVGPFEVRGVDRNGYRWFLCGSDTSSIYDPNASAQFTCPNGDPNPHQMLVQRVYSRNGSLMSFQERITGRMAYHPTHGHYHVDDWEIMTLRIQDPNDPNPLHWPIAGEGNKVGFCLEDFYDCGTNSGSPAYGHCRDSANNILLNSSFHNYNLGGGNYNCSPVVQGISVGHTDVYYEGLDGQWIDIPPHTCNGNYYIVIEVDPHNYFRESNEHNNVIAVPFTLTQQSPAGSPVIEITSDRSPVLCSGDSITLTATGGYSYLWTTSETTQSIRVPSAPNSYGVTVDNYCGTGTDNFSVSEVIRPAIPVAVNDSICSSGSATLTATGSGILNWYDGIGHWLGSGSVFNTPTISSNTTFYVDNSEGHTDTIHATPHDKAMGGGAYSTTTQYLIFNAESNFKLLTAKVYANTSGTRTFQLQDSTGAVLQAAVITIPAGESRVNLDFTVPVGNKYRLACAGAPDLYRNSGATVSFPYGIPGTVKITGSSGGAASYYFFYDWEVATNAAYCTSQRVSAEAVVGICTGMHENVAFKNSINVYPNPASGNFTIGFDVPQRGSVNVEIMDLIGKSMFTKAIADTYSKNRFTVGTELFAKGIYILKVDYDGISYYKKIVLE